MRGSAVRVLLRARHSSTCNARAHATEHTCTIAIVRTLDRGPSFMTLCSCSFKSSYVNLLPLVLHGVAADGIKPHT